MARFAEDIPRDEECRQVARGSGAGVRARRCDATTSVDAATRTVAREGSRQSRLRIDVGNEWGGPAKNENSRLRKYSRFTAGAVDDVRDATDCDNVICGRDAWPFGRDPHDPGDSESVFVGERNTHSCYLTGAVDDVHAAVVVEEFVGVCDRRCVRVVTKLFENVVCSGVVVGHTRQLSVSDSHRNRAM